MNDWGLHGAQFVWFVSDTSGINPEDIYRTLFDSEPDNVQRNRIPGPTNPLLGLAAGQTDMAKHNVTLQPGRIDVGISSANEPDKLLPIEATFASFLDTVTSKAIAFANCVRVAAVAHTMLEVPSYNDGIKIVTELSGFSNPLGDISDFSVQLNKRRPLDDGRQINRLVRYEVATLQTMLMQMTGQPTLIPTTSERHSAVVVFDINTVPDGRTIAIHDQLPIWKGMISEVLRLADTKHINQLQVQS